MSARPTIQYLMNTKAGFDEPAAALAGAEASMLGKSTSPPRIRSCMAPNLPINRQSAPLP